MNQNDPTCKPFERPQIEAGQLPPPLGELYADRVLLPEMTAEDLREMSKFHEIPNIEGLAAHAVAFPLEPDPGEPPLTPHFESEVSGAILKSLRWELKRTHSLVVRGALGGASGAPFNVQIVMPQAGAPLAMALQQMLWPLADANAPIAHTLLLWPRPLKDKHRRVLAENWFHQRAGTGFGITIGNDDLYLAEALLRAAADEFWKGQPQMRRIPASEGIMTVDRAAGTARFTKCGMRNAECGTGEREGEGGDGIFFTEDTLIEEEGWISPVWANPKVPALALAGSETLQHAARGLGSILLGVASDGKGRFPLLHQAHNAEALEDETGLDCGGYVIVPRRLLPEPFMNEARRWKRQE